MGRCGSLRIYKTQATCLSEAVFFLPNLLASLQCTWSLIFSKRGWNLLITCLGNICTPESRKIENVIQKIWFTPPFLSSVILQMRKQSHGRWGAWQCDGLFRRSGPWIGFLVLIPSLSQESPVPGSLGPLPLALMFPRKFSFPGQQLLGLNREMDGVKRPWIKFLFLFVHCFANIYNGMRISEE